MGFGSRFRLLRAVYARDKSSLAVELGICGGCFTVELRMLEGCIKMVVRTGYDEMGR